MRELVGSNAKFGEVDLPFLARSQLFANTIARKREEQESSRRRQRPEWSICGGARGSAAQGKRHSRCEIGSGRGYSPHAKKRRAARFS
jgi:hypothetical protein